MGPSLRPALVLRRLAPRRLVLVLVLVPIAVVGLAGCGGDDDSAGSRGATTTTTTAPTATPTATPTVAQQAPQTETARVGDCLRKLGYRLTGGPPQTKDSEAPDYQIVLASRRGGGYIGFYRNVSRAKRVAKRLRANARRTSGAAAERHGSINIVWVDLSDSAARRAVRGCLVT